MRRALAVAAAVGGGVLSAGPAWGQVGFTVTGPRGRVLFSYGAGVVPPPPGYGYGYGPFGFAPGPVVVVRPQPSAASVIQAMFPPSADAEELARRPVPKADPAGFRVIRPQNPPNNGARRPAPPAAPRGVAPAAPDPGPVPKDPKQAAVFHVAAARAAFAAEQYGRAAERLAEAVAADPADPLGYFLLAQVRTARGEYAEAVAAIRDGMARAPDWPASGFRIRELYGRDQRRFDAHLAELRRAAGGRPDDPTLAFLLGYHLWFLGERDEAAKQLRKAAGAVRDRGLVERFLVEADGKDA